MSDLDPVRSGDRPDLTRYAEPSEVARPKAAPPLAPRREVPADLPTPKLPAKAVENTQKAAAPVPAEVRADLRTQAKMDEFRQLLRGPYHTVDGLQIEVEPPFQINPPYANQPLRPEGELARQRAGLSEDAYRRVTLGRGTPDEVRRTTQALVDMQPPGKIPDSKALRQLMFDHRIGLDCAGFAQQEYLHATGRTRAQAGFTTLNNESLSTLGAQGFTRSQDPTTLRPGDIVVMNPPPYESVGHRAVVYDQRLLTPAEVQELSKSTQATHAAFLQGGPIRRIELDMSSGAGEMDGQQLVGKAETGGVGRPVFLYNESNHQWAEWKGSKEPLVPQANQIGGHPIEGFYRKVSP